MRDILVSIQKYSQRTLASFALHYTSVLRLFANPALLSSLVSSTHSAPALLQQPLKYADNCVYLCALNRPSMRTHLLCFTPVITCAVNVSYGFARWHLLLSSTFLSNQNSFFFIYINSVTCAHQRLSVIISMIVLTLLLLLQYDLFSRILFQLQKYLVIAVHFAAQQVHIWYIPFVYSMYIYACIYIRVRKKKLKFFLRLLL